MLTAAGHFFFFITQKTTLPFNRDRLNAKEVVQFRRNGGMDFCSSTHLGAAVSRTSTAPLKQPAKQFRFNFKRNFKTTFKHGADHRRQCRNLEMEWVGVAQAAGP
jgi:hypothetical protein